MRNGKLEMRNKKGESGNGEVRVGMALNWAPRNGKWDSNEDSRD